MNESSEIVTGFSSVNDWDFATDVYLLTSVDYRSIHYSETTGLMHSDY